MTVKAVMLGIEQRLETVPGLVMVSAVRPESVTVPAAIVGIPDIPDYHQSVARNKYELRPTILVLTSTAIDRQGQLELADYVSLDGPKSIPKAIHADGTLGGVAEDTQVLSFGRLRIEDFGRIGYFGGEFMLKVMVREIAPEEAP